MLAGFFKYVINKLPAVEINMTHGGLLVESIDGEMRKEQLDILLSKFINVQFEALYTFSLAGTRYVVPNNYFHQLQR